MKAIVLTKTGSPEKAFQFMDQLMPKMSDDEVLIKVAYSGLNFADVMARKGLYKDAPAVPFVPGYDVSGYVEAKGKNVRSVEIGDAVFGITRFGGYSEYVSCNEMAVSKVPVGIDLAAATALATQFCTAYYSAGDMINLFEADTVLIHAAAGGVGSALVQYARHKKCIIFGTAGSDEKLEMLKKAGVHYPINYRSEDFAAQVMKITSGKGVNAIFDAVGGKSVSKGIKILSAGGKMVCYGASEMSSNANPIHQLRTGLAFGFYNPGLLTMASKSILGVNMLQIADHRPNVIKRVMDAVSGLTKEGLFVPILGKSFPVSEVAAAHNFMESRKSTGKLVLAW